jgi:hypothetical protein
VRSAACDDPAYRHLPLAGTAGWNGWVDEQLRRELLVRCDEDQRVRQLVSMPKDGSMPRLPDQVAAEWQRVDQDNTRWLGDLLVTRGWPGRTLVGEAGAQAAWLLAQHADDPVQQRACLDALRGAVAQGEASPVHLAYLEDRVRVRAGKLQLYGTQFTVTGGELGPFPIEDPQRLDERRAEAGLEPFAVYKACMQAEP